MVANCCVPGCKEKYRGSTKSNLLASNLETLNIKLKIAPKILLTSGSG
jgi:hypothetical protein